MESQLQRLLHSLQSRLPFRRAGQGVPSAGTQESVWPLVDAVQCLRGLGPELAPQPLAAGDARFVARADELDALAARVSDWREGRPGMVAVTGPQGCGLTSLLNQLPTRLDGATPCRHQHLTERLCTEADVLTLVARLFDLAEVPDSPERLIERLQTLEPRILILDDAHYLAFRVLGARGAARSLGAIMVGTQHRHLWIMACRLQAWRRLVYMHQVDRFFAHTLELGYFAAEPLGEVIAAHHGDVASETPGRDLLRLQQLSQGKPDLAFLYLRCGVMTESGGYRPLDTGALKKLDTDDLFTLAELAAHGTLNRDEHSQIFRLSADNSQLQLEQLRHQGLVEAVGQDTPQRRYGLTPALTALISDYLYKANYLY